MYTSWGGVTPFLLDNAQRFRPAAPPAVTTPAYAAALAEVRDLGRDSSTTRTPDQTVAGKFWSSAPVWNTWNQIAQQVVADRRASLAQATAAFSAMDLALADTAIAMYDAKYADPVWRPVTAIQLGGDPAWNPLTPTAADPSYPGAHSALSAAAATALGAFYGPDQPVTVTSAADPGVSRHFANLAAVADEAGLSRIWAGQHTRIDDEAGRQLGRQVAGVVLDDLQVHHTAG
jgi:PAP2 superfamily